MRETELAVDELAVLIRLIHGGVHGDGSLRLTIEARRILAESVPPMVAHERRMLSELTQSEQQTLSKLLAKLVVDSPNWPIEENRE